MKSFTRSIQHNETSRISNGKIFDFGITIKILNKIKYPEEKIDSLKPKFHFIPSNWHSDYIKTRMKDSKKAEGIDHPWMGYFLIGGRRNHRDNCFSRFNPNSVYYQAWFGVYILKNNGNTPFGFRNDKPNFENLIRAGIGDQHAWLKKYYVKRPICKPVTIGKHDSKLFSIRKRIGTYWEGSFITQSDLNVDGSSDWQYNKLFGKPELKFFTSVPEHHLIALEGFYIAGYDGNTNVTWIVYGVASKFQNNYGQIVSNYPRLKQEMLKMAENVELVSSNQ